MYFTVSTFNIKFCVIQSLHHHTCSLKLWASVVFDQFQRVKEVAQRYDNFGLAARSFEAEEAVTEVDYNPF